MDELALRFVELARERLAAETPYEGRDTALYTDIQQPDYDSVEEEWRTDAGFEVRLEGAHGLIKGLPIS